MFIKILLLLLPPLVLFLIEIIFLIKSKTLLRNKIIIFGATLSIFLLLGGFFFVQYVHKEIKINQYISAKNNYIDTIIENTSSSVKDYDKNKTYSSDKVLNYLVSAYLYTINGENIVSDAIQDKIDGKITSRELSKIINTENDTLTAFSDSCTLLCNSGYLTKENKYKSSIISGCIYSLVNANKNFIIKGITSETITDFDDMSTEASNLMKSQLNL